MSGDFTIHGGRLADARARFGGRVEEWLDLSTGINPIAWPGAEAAAVDWRALPDPNHLRDMERRAAEYFGADLHLCHAVPGSEFGLRALAGLIGLPGLHLSPAYGTHADAFEQAEPIASITHLPAGRRTLVLANPNNPDGRILPREALLRILGRQERNDGWLIVDEAFADVRAEWSIATEVAERRRLVVLRSFGKFFGLAGVRLGFVIAPTVLLGRLQRLLGAWPVSSAAQAFGAAAYADREWIAATRRDLPVRASRMDDVLHRHGLASQGECPLFRLIETPEAATLFTKLAQRHVLTRPFERHPHLLRLGLVAGDAALARLDRALTECRDG